MKRRSHCAFFASSAVEFLDSPQLRLTGRFTFEQNKAGSRLVQRYCRRVVPAEGLTLLPQGRQASADTRVPVVRICCIGKPLALSGLPEAIGWSPCPLSAQGREAAARHLIDDRRWGAADDCLPVLIDTLALLIVQGNNPRALRLDRANVPCDQPRGGVCARSRNTAVLANEPLRFRR